MEDTTTSERYKSPNPFTESLIINVFYRKVKVGYSTGGGTLYESKPVDVEHKITVYPNQLSESFFKLSKNGQRMLFYIMTKLTANQDYLQLKESITSVEIGLSRSGFYRTINELTELSIIAPRKQRINTYWINPRMLFAGNRLAMYPENIVRINDPLKVS